MDPSDLSWSLPPGVHVHSSPSYYHLSHEDIQAAWPLALRVNLDAPAPAEPWGDCNPSRQLKRPSPNPKSDPGPKAPAQPHPDFCFGLAPWPPLGPLLGALSPSPTIPTLHAVGNILRTHHPTYFFFFFCWAHSMPKFPGQGLNPSHISDNLESLAGKSSTIMSP